MKKLFIFIVLFAATLSYAQEIEIEEQIDVQRNFNDVAHNKGRMFVFWGWNRGSYSKSDITFKGDDYNFTLYDTKARDKPKPFGIYYFKLDEVTIPQTNFRVGYFFHDHYNVALGVDHMKYVMHNDQTVKFSGDLPVGSELYTSNGNTIDLTEDFLTFEHTDGLNYVTVEVNRFDTVDNWIGFGVKNIDINLTEGIGIGALYPKTNTKLLGKERYDDFHVSGWGMSAHVGLDVTFFKYFFIQYTFKAGYINMQDIRTTGSKTDSASQDFIFLENMWVFGGKFNVVTGKNKKKKK
ncbi:hypothetical protein ACFQ5N_10925 [Lutibacter holmesii]|uniref:Outermembrane protein n=1 Tax=Lutibacter holmesii TaxID=1137985 RepID=A0ABW3WPZ1_9FLAO